MELSDLEIDDVGVPLHLRKGLEDGYHLIQRAPVDPAIKQTRTLCSPHTREAWIA